MPTSIDLFSGAGGLAEGFRQAGFTCLYGTDYKKHAMATFAANHPGALTDCRPIEEIDPAEVRSRLGVARGEVDAICGGCPCQGFSINNASRFLEDPRNSLFKHYVRFLEEFKPRGLVFENVPGMLSLGGGVVFRQAIAEFQRLGYHVTFKVLYAPHYGVPQDRWRLIVLGSLDGPISHPTPTHWAMGRGNFGHKEHCMTMEGCVGGMRQATIRDALSDLPRLKMGEGGEEVPYDREPESEYAKEMRAGSVAAYNHFASQLGPENEERMKYIPPGGSWRDIPTELLPRGMKSANRSCHTKRYGRLSLDGLSSTIMTKADLHWGAFILPDQDRTLTVREAARLQSFPDRYRFSGPRVQQFVQVGNAVPVMLARAVAWAMLASRP